MTGVPLEAVPLWGTMFGIGHAIAREQPSGWYWTACGSWSPSWDLSKDKPKRICSKCRARLASARLLAANHSLGSV